VHVNQIHVVDVGQGPSLLCLHGIGSSSASFAPQLDELAGDLRVLAWDAPGYGKSEDPDAPLDLDGFADAAAEVLETRQTGPAHVLGVSWGGVVAIRLAVRHPDLVRSLIVADSSRGSGRTAAQVEAMTARVDELRTLGPDAFAARRAGRLVSDQAPAELVSAVEETMSASVRLPGYGYAAQSMADTDLTDELSAVRSPTLVLCGAEDTVTGIEESQAIAGGIPDAVFVSLQGAGHLANQESPDAFNAWVFAYVQIIERLYR
jgi:pimeloyl-ACP methyl ester carboxylesterase